MRCFWKSLKILERDKKMAQQEDCRALNNPPKEDGGGVLDLIKYMLIF